MVFADKVKAADYRTKSGIRCFILGWEADVSPVKALVDVFKCCRRQLGLYESPEKEAAHLRVTEQGGEPVQCFFKGLQVMSSYRADSNSLLALHDSGN